MGKGKKVLLVVLLLLLCGLTSLFAESIVSNKKKFDWDVQVLVGGASSKLTNGSAFALTGAFGAYYMINDKLEIGGVPSYMLLSKANSGLNTFAVLASARYQLGDEKGNFYATFGLGYNFSLKAIEAEFGLDVMHITAIQYKIDYSIPYSSWVHTITITPLVILFLL